MYREGLLTLAGRLEEAGHIQEAGRAYAALANEPQPSGEDRGCPKERARQRLDALSGIGSAGARAEVLLRGMSREVLNPSLLIGLTAASAVFRLTRVAALSKFSSGGVPSFLTRGWGMRAGAGTLAFGAEALTFPLATRLGSTLLGQGFEWNPSQVASEIQSSFVLLGALRFARVTTGSRMRPRLQAYFLQAGTLGGILLGHRLEEELGLRPRLDGATTLTDSVAMLFQFHVAGRVAQSLLGRGFRQGEISLDLRARHLESGGTARWTEGLFPRPLAATPGSSPLLTLMSGSQGGDGGGSKRPPRGDPTLPFIPVFSGPAREKGGQDPLEVHSLLQLHRRMGEPELRFKDRLEADHVTFRLTGPFPENLEPVIEPIQRLLNHLAESGENKIPFGRRVVIMSEETQRRVVFQKTLMGGFQVLLPSASGPSSEVPGQELANADPSASEPPPSPASPLKRRSSGTFAVNLGLGSPTSRVPLVTDSLDRLPMMVRTAMLQRLEPGSPYSFILEETAPFLESFEEAMREMAPSLPPETRLRILVPRDQRTFLGEMRGGELHWREEPDPNWERIEGQSVFREILLRAPEEVYLYIAAMSRDGQRADDTQTTFRFIGEGPEEGILSPFVSQALSYYRLKGENLTIWLNRTNAIVFRQNEGRWQVGDAPPNEPLPEDPPPLANPHFARVREILRDLQEPAPSSPQEDRTGEPREGTPGAKPEPTE